ncbi:lysophospholipid acyltransferase family protein [Halorhodospira halochloris]|uniref:lysophospholipid acyltransferase family protein n=1 Tax=Halorhodospira halochloris TaxID=1052 RepID=UPI001EE7BE83|nr:lysophospholipid acyltransferase family protein [Halorhodospira halochloris]MCG5530945.1 lysophospholipid acyltransferase family protein [Halorhodospira halochloris]
MAVRHWKTRSVDGLLSFFALLPLPALHMLGWLVGHLAYIVPNRARLIAATNINLCFPSKPTAQQRRLLRLCLVETGKTALEIGPIFKRQPQWLTRRWVADVFGAEHIEASLEHGKGLIFLAPHFGCWELLNMWVAERRPLTALYRPPRQRSLEPILLAGRSRSGVHMLPAGTQGIRGVMKALHAGESVGILPDQEPEGNEPFAPLFGQPAKTMTLASRVAYKSQAPVLFACARRLPAAKGFELHFIPADADIANPDPQLAAAAVNRGVEACVRLAPEQYQWTYKRFATQPDGHSPYPGRGKRRNKRKTATRA